MEYITYAEDGRIEVRCKGECKTVIACGAAGVVQPTLAYCELVIAMKEANGVLGKHETGVCKPCKWRMLNGGLVTGELDAIYSQDVEQWAASAMKEGMGAIQLVNAVSQMGKRFPLTVLNEAGRGEVAAA